MEANEFVLKVEAGALIELPTVNDRPLWESHARGKNWMAAITTDPQAPGGLSRDFWQKAKGDYFYIVPTGLTVGTPVEIGADYYTGAGNPQRRRFYGFVSAVAPHQITLIQCKTARAAIRQSEEFSPAVVTESEPLQAARAALAALTEAERAILLRELA